MRHPTVRRRMTAKRRADARLYYELRRQEKERRKTVPTPPPESGKTWNAVKVATVAAVLAAVAVAAVVLSGMLL